MAKDRNNIRIYGDLASGLWVAPKGTADPASLAALTAPWVEAGWISEDGVDLDRSVERQEHAAWQGGTVVRVKASKVQDTFKFQALEENKSVLGLYYRGAVGVTTTGVAKFSITNQTASDERAFVADFIDGTVTKRLVVPSGEVTDAATISHKNSDLTVYEMTVTIYGDYFIYTNAPALI